MSDDDDNDHDLNASSGASDSDSSSVETDTVILNSDGSGRFNHSSRKIWKRLLRNLASDDPGTSEVKYYSERDCIDDGMALELVNALENNRTLVALKLNILELTSIGARTLASFLSSSRSAGNDVNCNLRTLGLGLFEDDSSSSHLSSISVRRMDYHRYAEVMDIMLQAAGDCSSLEELWLEQVPLGCHEKKRGTDNRESSLQRLLRNTESLRALLIKECPQPEHSPYQASAAGFGLQHNGTLRTLEFCGSGRGGAQESPLLNTLLLHAQKHPALEELILRCCWSPRLGHLLEHCSGSSRLKRLQLHSCGYLLGSPERAESTFRGLERNKSVTSLVLHESSSAPNHPREFFASLLRVLQRNATLESLDLSAPNLLRTTTTGGAEMIRGGLLENSTLRTLKLCKTGLWRSQHMQGLSQLLQQPNRSLRELYLSGNQGLDGNAGLLLAQGLRSASCTLSLLDLSGCSLANDGMQAVSQGLVSNTSLTTLAVPRNGIGVNGLRALLDLLNSNSVLQHVNISGNHISFTEDGAAVAVGEEIGSMLERNATLVDLDLGSCPLSSGDVVRVFSALDANATLQSLNVRGSDDFYERPMLALANTLPRMRGLRTLKMTGPCDGFASTETLDLVLQGFGRNTSLLRVETDEPRTRWKELSFYLARNRLIPFLNGNNDDGKSHPSLHSGSGPVETRLVPSGRLWPAILARVGNCWKDDPGLQVSLVHYLLSHKPIW